MSIGPPGFSRYFLEDELFPKKGTIAQVPYVYERSHNVLLNRIMKEGIPEMNEKGEVVSYLLKEEPEEPRPAPQLYAVTGDKKPPGYNWLSDLPEGTTFLTRPYKPAKDHPFLDEYHVIFQFPKSTKLMTNLNSVGYFVVDPSLFCRTMELFEVLGKVEDYEPIAEDSDRPD